MRFKIIELGLLLALASCAKQDYVKTDATLGKVVVYRNGVAYYERRAVLDKDTLRIRVPRDKVNDFLKSLTVRDAPAPLHPPLRVLDAAGGADLGIPAVEGSVVLLGGREIAQEAAGLQPAIVDAVLVRRPVRGGLPHRC